MPKFYCLVLRDGGSRIDLPDYDGGFQTYHFTGPAGGPHVADVKDERQAELLRGNAHFREFTEEEAVDETAPGESDLKIAELRSQMTKTRDEYKALTGKNASFKWSVSELHEKMDAFIAERDAKAEEQRKGEEQRAAAAAAEREAAEATKTSTKKD